MSLLPRDELLAAKPAGWDDAVRRHDLFEGDFGDGTERTLVNEIRVVQRVGKPCFICCQPLQRGRLCWVVKKSDAEGFYGGRVCEVCCDAIAATSEPDDEDDDFDLDDDSPDPFDALQARYDLGEAARSAI